MPGTAAAFARLCQTSRQTFSSSALRASASDREGPTLLLAASFVRSYNTGIAPFLLAQELMDKFEELGRRLDEELTRLRKYVEEEVAPETEKRTAQFLREVSEKLAEASRKLESRVAARNSQNQQPKS